MRLASCKFENFISRRRFWLSFKPLYATLNQYNTKPVIVHPIVNTQYEKVVPSF